jgi:hypothetical protein
MNDLCVVDGIQVEAPEAVSLPLELICSIIRNNLPGLSVVRVGVDSTAWTRDSGVTLYHDCKVILDMPGKMYSEHRAFLSCEPTLDDVLDCLEEAMLKATDNRCACCGDTAAWPTFETLAGRIRHAVEALA